MDKDGPYKPVDCKPDLIVKMTLQTFNKLAEKKLGGAFAFLTQRVQLDGTLFTMKDFEGKVLLNYFPDLYAKDEKDEWYFIEIYGLKIIVFYI